MDGFRWIGHSVSFSVSSATDHDWRSSFISQQSIHEHSSTIIIVCPNIVCTFYLTESTPAASAIYKVGNIQPASRSNVLLKCKLCCWMKIMIMMIVIIMIKPQDFIQFSFRNYKFIHSILFHFLISFLFVNAKQWRVKTSAERKTDSKLIFISWSELAIFGSHHKHNRHSQKFICFIYQFHLYFVLFHRVLIILINHKSRIITLFRMDEISRGFSSSIE